jgi:hypothetical protein
MNEVVDLEVLALSSMTSLDDFVQESNCSIRVKHIL